MQELIKIRALSEDFADRLDPYVREKFLELAGAVRSGRKTDARPLSGRGKRGSSSVRSSMFIVTNCQSKFFAPLGAKDAAPNGAETYLVACLSIQLCAPERCRDSPSQGWLRLSEVRNALCHPGFYDPSRRDFCRISILSPRTLVSSVSLWWTYLSQNNHRGTKNTELAPRNT